MNDMIRKLESARDNLGSIMLRLCIQDLLPLDNEQCKMNYRRILVTSEVRRQRLELAI